MFYNPMFLFSCWSNGLANHGIKFGSKKTLYGRAIFRISLAIPRAFNEMAARSTASAMGLVPFNPRVIIEGAGQWGGGPKPMSAEQQSDVLKAYPECVDLMARNGIITDDDFDRLNIPWGALEQHIKRDELCPSRWRASSYMHPKIREARSTARLEAARKQLAMASEACEQALAKKLDGQMRWEKFKKAGFLLHRKVEAVTNAITASETRNGHLVSILHFLGYTGKTNINRPFLIEALEQMELPVEHTGM